MLYGLLLKTVRRMKGYTQQQVASAINVSRVKYSRLETNLIQIDYETLASIAKFYGTTVEDFVTWGKLFNSSNFSLNIKPNIKMR